jgi:hypothetical protein
MKYLILKALLAFILVISIDRFSISQVALNQDNAVNVLFESTGEQYFLIPAADPLIINELSRIISIDRVDKNGDVYAYANRKGFERFLDLGLHYEILPHPGIFHGNLNMKSEIDIRNIQEWDFYPTYDAYVDMMYQFAEEYPDLCQVISFGTSVQNRQLLAAKISDNIGESENEAQFLYTSSMHGDELTGYVLMLRMIDYLLSNYGTDPRITSMVDNMEIWINPLANPDGTYRGGNNTVNYAVRYNNNNVDLNRNYRDPEDGPHPDGEEWQPETVHFMELAEDNHFVSSANIHGGTAVCNYPWDTWPRLAADDAWWQYVCHEYADTVHANCPISYMTDYDNGITNGYAWYTISGGRQDYMNYFQQCREFTLEISKTKLLQPDSLPFYWDFNYRSLLNYMEQSTFGLHGTVKDSVTGLPLKAEIFVVLHEKDSSWIYSALPNGDYHRLLAEGTYTVRYSAPGYLSREIPGVSIINKQSTIIDIKLLPEGVGGIDNDMTGRLIRFYPNPLSGNILHFETATSVSFISVYDLAGKSIKDIDIDFESCTINTESLNDGLYFFRFDTQNGHTVKKIVIKR